MSQPPYPATVVAELGRWAKMTIDLLAPQPRVENCLIHRRAMGWGHAQQPPDFGDRQRAPKSARWAQQEAQRSSTPRKNGCFVILYLGKPGLSNGYVLLQAIVIPDGAKRQCLGFLHDRQA